MRLCIVAFACGIALLQLQRELPGGEWLAALAALGVVGQAVWAVAGDSAAIRSSFGRARGGALWGALGCALWRTFGAALLGFAWAGWLAQQRLADALPAAWELREIALTGVVASLPQRFERGERFVFDVDSAQPQAARVPHRILLSWYHDADLSNAGDREESADARTLLPGQRWRFTVRLKRPHGNANPHGFDYEAWLLERNVRATGSIRGSGERLDDFVARPGYAIERLRDALRKRFVDALPDAPYLGVLIALAVGDQRAIANDQWTVFNRTGVTHLMSI